MKSWTITPLAAPALLLSLLSLPFVAVACGGRLDSTSTTPTGKPVPVPAPTASDDAGGLILPSGAIAVRSATGIAFYPPGAVTETLEIGHLDWPRDSEDLANIVLDPDGGLYIDGFLLGSDPSAPAPGRIDIFAPGSVGSAAPVRTIFGSNTGLGNIRAMAIDAQGFLYVANANGANGGEVDVFAPYATGNVAPVRTISPTFGSVWLPSGMALDSKGELFVGDSEGAPIQVFAPGASGLTAASRVLAGYADSDDPTGVAVQSNGGAYVSLWAANSVMAFGTDASGEPIGSIAGDQTGINQPMDVAVDPTGRVLVANQAGGVRIFAPGALGNVAPVAVLREGDGYNVAVMP